MIEEKKNKFMSIKTILSFISRLTDDALKIKSVKNYKTFSNILFTKISNNMKMYFEPLKNSLESSDMNILPNTYLNLSLSTSILAATGSIIIILFETTIIQINPTALIIALLTIPAISFLIIFSLFYLYPFHKVKVKEKNINTNLPFALNHMAAIASAGVPPEKCFEMLAEFKEYGGVSEESRNVVRRIKAFGDDITLSIKYVAKRTPSRDFKNLLYGMLSIIESGGNLNNYLNEMAKLALFNYKLSRKKYISSLSTYADIYTAILIAAPLFLVTILSVMNIVPGSAVGGISITYFMSIGIYVIIPTLNILFLIFLIYSQPEM